MSEATAVKTINRGLKWTVRVVVTLIALLVEASMATAKTLDPGSVLVAMLIVLGATIFVWWLTRTKR